MVRHLNIPLNDEDWPLIEAWRKRVQKARGGSGMSWEALILLYAQSQILPWRENEPVTPDDEPDTTPREERT